ncbi:MAG: DNA topoisomerase IV subunit A [Neomegalonema sp.]|nr:DNA topoisomerase IV subunit A [Neomegalonema sp.]
MTDVLDLDGAGPDGSPGNVSAESLRRALGDRYLQYALSTIMHRALPDARDGMKPVHRRILFAMRGLKLDPTTAFKKCAKIVGEVMGNYHPHGDQAIYDALVRLAQDFAVRYPLVDGQGNFGNIDGDNPAAQRYTEARLTQIATLLLDGLDEDAVDFQPNYDGSEEEPAVLPAAFPNLLANGSSGIAVGMATNIPPHNVGELCDALLHCIKYPGATVETLVDFVPGPDFPTGGILIEPRSSILQAYKTGRGAFRLRARWQVEDLGRGTWQIIVTEIPYQVQKSKLIERLAELVTAKKIPIFGDVRDESAEDVRIVIEPRAKTVDPALLMETLFRQSDLEIRFPLNMNVLKDGRTPEVLDLPMMLRVFLDHRREVLVRRSRHRLEKVDRRIEILEGYLIAYLNLDRVIEIIRNEDEPKPIMMAEFGLTEVQTEAILNMRLRSLRRLEEFEIKKEREELQDERDALNALIGDEELQWKRVGTQIREVREKFGKASKDGARRTTIEDAPQIEEVPLEAMIEREPITVICSAHGWVRAQKGHQPLDAEIKYKDGDTGRFVFHAETTDKLMLFGSNGRFYTLACDKLPGGRGMGEPVRLMIDLGQEDEIVDLFVHRPGTKRIVAGSDGKGFIVAEDDAVAQTRSGKQVLIVDEGNKAVACALVSGDMVAAVGSNRKLLVFPLDELPEMGRGKGVILQKLKFARQQFELADVTTFERANGLSWHDPAGRTRTETALASWIGARASAGADAPRGFPRDNKFT